MTPNHPSHSDYDDFDPRNDPNAAVGGGDERALVERDSAALEVPEGTLPVLEAFQRFLDEERRRARHRMVMMSCIFAVLIVLLIIAGVAVTMRLVTPVQYSVHSMRNDMSHLARESEYTADRLDEAMKRFRRQDSDLTEALRRERQALADARMTMRRETQDIASNVERMRSTVTRLELENERLRDELRVVKTEAPDPVRAMRPSPDRSVARREPPVPRPSSGDARTAKPADRFATFSMQIRPDGSDGPMSWRMPIRE